MLSILHVGHARIPFADSKETNIPPRKRVHTFTRKHNTWGHRRIVSTRSGFRAGQGRPKRAPTKWSYMNRAQPGAYANAGPDLGMADLPLPPLLPPPPPPPPTPPYSPPSPPPPTPPHGKMRLAAHITPKYVLPRGPHSLKSSSGTARHLCHY